MRLIDADKLKKRISESNYRKDLETYEPGPPEAGGGDGMSKTILFPTQNVSFGQAFSIVRNSLNDDSIPYKSKVLAIEKIAELETHNSVTKADLVAALRWIFSHYDFEW